MFRIMEVDQNIHCPSYLLSHAFMGRNSNITGMWQIFTISSFLSEMTKLLSTLCCLPIPVATHPSSQVGKSCLIFLQGKQIPDWKD